MSEKEEYQPWHMNSSLMSDKDSMKNKKMHENENLETLQNKTNQTTKKRKLNIQSK